MKRRHFLRAILRSPAVRFAGLLAVAAAFGCVLFWLWQARDFNIFAGVAVIAVIAMNALLYLFASPRRRRAMDAESRHTRSHWSYANRGFVGSGFGIAVGNIAAYRLNGDDPTFGVIIGAAFILFGAVAHVVWDAQRPA